MRRGVARLMAGTFLLASVSLPAMSRAVPPVALPLDGFATGVIVQWEPGAGAAAMRQARSSLASRDASARLLPGDEMRIAFDAPRPVAEARAMVAELSDRDDVQWAEPDLLLSIADSPVIPNDARFDEQWALWDPPVKGDFGLQAPLAWQWSAGAEDVVVAVLDTGWTTHPDLDGQVINGYDFVSDRRFANDGNGRDRDARDPGDWVTPSEATRGCEASASSWHGTHVAGTVVAQQGNRHGISGVAPASRVLAVRVIGKCGATTSDTADAIIWSAGGSIAGVPRNPHPASVINLSLGGPGACGPSFGRAVDFALSRGVQVVVAAGNEGKPISTSSPANCSGVISVVATNSEGKRPRWSNYGTRSLPATVAAPGDRIISTHNSGTRGPGSPTYYVASGTSMAAPHVAGVVALLRAIDVPSEEVVNVLGMLTGSFPSSGSGVRCDRTLCGPGILSLAALGDLAPDPDPGPDPEPEPEPEPTGAPGMVTDVTVNYSPRGPVATVTVRWRDAASSAKATGFRYRVRIGSGKWSGWNAIASTSVRLEDVPRGKFSLLEVAGVNSRGIGPVFQVTLFPN